MQCVDIGRRGLEVAAEQWSLQRSAFVLERVRNATKSTFLTLLNAVSANWLSFIALSESASRFRGELLRLSESSHLHSTSLAGVTPISRLCVRASSAVASVSFILAIVKSSFDVSAGNMDKANSLASRIAG